MTRKFRVDASKKVEAKKQPLGLHVAFDDLDDRFAFELDDEFEIYLDTLADRVSCYTLDSSVFGDGSGVCYSVAVAVPREKVHWQIQQDIERNLERYIQEQTEGSDYTGWVEDNETVGTTYNIADEVLDNCEVYVYDVCVIPYQNIGPDGSYGIDYGVESSEYEEE